MSTTSLRRRVAVLAATGATAAGLAVLPAGPANALRSLDPPSGHCGVVRSYVAHNPSMNKPRGDQQTPDHRHWDAGCR